MKIISPTRLIFVGFALLSVAVMTAAGFLLTNYRNHIFAESGRNLSNIVLILANRLENILSATARVQARVIARNAAFEIVDAAERDRQLSRHDLHRMLRDSVAGLSLVGSLTIINAQGRVINFSRQWPVPNIDASDRDFFKALQSPDITSFISEPVFNRATGTLVMHFARRISGPNKEFFGLITAAIELDLLQNSISELALVPNGGIALFREDGMLLARVPRIESDLGRRFGNAVSLRLVSTADHGVGVSEGAIRGDIRVIAARRVAGYPIVISAGSPTAAILSHWWQTVAYVMSVSIVAIIAFAAFAFLLIKTIGHYRILTRISVENENEKQLRQQNQRFDAALNNMTQGLLSFDADGTLVAVNRQYIKMYGLSPDVVKPGCSFRDLIVHRQEAGTFSGDIDQYVDRLATDLAAAKNTSRVVETADGRAINIVNCPLPDGGWVATHEDITDKRRADEERDQNREFINRIIDNVPVAIIVKNVSDRRIAYINQATEKLWGLSRSDAIGKTMFDVFPNDRARLISADDDEVLQSDEPRFFDAHYNLASASDDRILISKKLAIRAPDGTPKFLVSVIEDVTERKAIEAQLRQAQKMEAIGNLTGGVAHDFNNLLTVMIGNLDLLLEESVERPQTTQKVDAILKAALRGAGLTKQMLAFSRRQPLQPTCIDLNSLVDRTAQLLARTLGEGIRIDMRGSPDVCPISVDGAQLEAALVNIAINARDAMPRGGTLTIETGKVRFDGEDVARRPGLAPGDYVVLRIADTGAGIPDEIINHIFEPFFTTKETGKGTGLGLSMVYGFVKQSGGYIGVTSAPGAGTTFELCFPAAIAAALGSNTSSASTDSVGSQPTGNVVLVVDDQPEVRATAVAHLTSLGYRVREADCAQAALDELAAGARIDVLFTDIVMPGGVNGIELAKRARAERPDLKVLYASGYPGAEIVDSFKVGIGSSLLAKPYRKQELAKAISEVLAAA